ncbi:MAG: hypothetical protein QOH34_1883 [Mycobacterium sp.]|jgi:hypothetical protein|nr:hypothetical protein [Mycobacterium sp.]MDT5200361.1 hypothetical protein [Mycobacterium sp.]
MSRRLLISTLAFLLAMLGGVASACSTAGSHQGTGQQAGSSAGALVKLPETANVEYGEVTDLPPDAKAQTITFKDITGRAEGFGLRTYPNDDHVALMSWISTKWDPGRLLYLRPCRSSIGDCVLVVDSTTYQTNASPPQPDFPTLAAVVVGDRVVAVNRLNGMPSRPSDILDVLGVVQQ